MLYELESFRKRCERPVTVEDITMVIGVRAHEGNPWVPARLRMLAGYYDPEPAVLIVDFGSPPEGRREIERICETAGFGHLYVDDVGTYSAACARNAGAVAAQTDFLFFNDVDCSGERDLFARLVRLAEASGFGACFDQVIDLPVYHLDEGATTAVVEADGPAARSRLLTRAFVRGAYSGRGDGVDFVAPYSNMFLCHRSFFDFAGGYDPAFRGHGSEDFELLIRLARISGQFPWPKGAAEDRYGPITPGFHAGGRPYRGFRRLFEVMAFQAEVSGLRVAHLHHPKPSTDPWIRDADQHRTRFTARVGPYLRSYDALLGHDFLPRPRRALALLNERARPGLLMPLRLAGYELVPVRVSTEAGRREAAAAIEHRRAHAVARVQGAEPDGTDVRELVGRARQAGLETVVISPGPLPDSWRYESSPPEPGASATPFSSEELAVAEEYSRRAVDVCQVDTAAIAELLTRECSFFRSGADGTLDLAYAFNFRTSLWSTRAALSHRVAQDSYAAARLDIPHPSAESLRPPGGSLQRRLRKLVRDPGLYLEDSRFPPLRWLGRRYLR